MATPDQNRPYIFLSYSEENQDLVEALVRRLQGDARASPSGSAPGTVSPGLPIQEQMAEALRRAQVCAVFIGGGSGQIECQQ